MKKVYWRPHRIPATAHLLIAVLALGGFIALEAFQTKVKQAHYQEKLAAARLALEAMQVVKNERLRQGWKIDPETDPARSGLIGSLVTPVTSEAGDLEAKQTSVNPNFAAVVVQLLKQAGVKTGDKVAVSFSGSFPALNISVLAALQTLKLKPVIISVASASQWGANDPDFLWIDMERNLNSKGLFPFRSSAASLGGKNDRGREMTEKGRDLLLKGIRRNGLIMIQAKNVRESIDSRMSIYHRDAPPKVFVNVGGGIASAGIRPYKVLIKPGVLLSEQPGDNKVDSLISRFVREGVPAIHLGNVKRMAEKYGMPAEPSSIPPVGEGRIYFRKEYNLWIAGGLLLGIVFTLYIFSRSDWGFRLLQASARKEEHGAPEPMI